MRAFKLSFAAACVICVILSSHVLAGPAVNQVEKTMSNPRIQAIGSVKNAESGKAEVAVQRGREDGTVTPKRYYFYDEATDAYLYKVIAQAEKLWKNGDPNEAISLLIREQTRLDQNKRKVNLTGKFVRTRDGEIRRLKDGITSTLPIVPDDEVPRLPSPLIVTLMTIRMDSGQSPLEMIDYYQTVANNHRGNHNSIIAAFQTVQLLGFENKKAWEFVNATFDQAEKDLLITNCIVSVFSKASVNRISQNDLCLALKQIAPEQVSDNIEKCYNNLIKDQQDVIEPQLWQSCPEWTNFNLNNRLERARVFHHEQKYRDALSLYKTVLARYKDQKDIYDKVLAISIDTEFDEAIWCRQNQKYAQAIELYHEILKSYPDVNHLLHRVQYNCLETKIEEIFRGGNEYQLCQAMLDDHRDLFDGASDYSKKAYALQALCQIFSDNKEQAQQVIEENALASELFAGGRLISVLSPKQRMLFDDYAWDHCPQWHSYHREIQYGYAKQFSVREEYSQSLKYFERLHSREKQAFSQEMLMNYAKSAIRSEECDLAVELMQQFQDSKTIQNVFSQDVLWLLQNGKAGSAISMLTKLEALLGEDTPLDARMHFYRAYAYALNNQFSESESDYVSMKTQFPKSIYTLKMTYLVKQKERLQRAFQFTQHDRFAGLISKAARCFDQGEPEMALGIYLRVFAEYNDRLEECSRACYLLGYYYLLSGEFEAANDILTFLKQEYATTGHAKEADILIQRMKDLSII